MLFAFVLLGVKLNTYTVYTKKDKEGSPHLISPVLSRGILIRFRAAGRHRQAVKRRGFKDSFRAKANATNTTWLSRRPLRKLLATHHRHRHHADQLNPA